MFKPKLPPHSKIDSVELSNDVVDQIVQLLHRLLDGRGYTIVMISQDSFGWPVAHNLVRGVHLDTAQGLVVLRGEDGDGSASIIFRDTTSPWAITSSRTDHPIFTFYDNMVVIYTLSDDEDPGHKVTIVLAVEPAEE